MLCCVRTFVAVVSTHAIRRNTGLSALRNSPSLSSRRARRAATLARGGRTFLSSMPGSRQRCTRRSALTFPKRSRYVCVNQYHPRRCLEGTIPGALGPKGKTTLNIYRNLYSQQFCWRVYCLNLCREVDSEKQRASW